MPDCGYMTTPNVSMAVPGLARWKRIASQPVSNVPKTALATKIQLSRRSASAPATPSRQVGCVCTSAMTSGVRLHLDRVVEHDFQQFLQIRLRLAIEPGHTDMQQSGHVRQ